MINLLEIKNNIPKEIFDALNDLYSLTGAKEIFEKHNIELMTAELEISLLEKVISDIKEVYAANAKTYKQVEQYTDMQIKNNTSLLETSEGFMKNIIEMNITTAKNQLEMAIKSFTPDILVLAKEKLITVANEDDRKILETTIDGSDITNIEESVSKAILELKEVVVHRYLSGDSKVVAKTETTKEKAPKEENKISKEKNTQEKDNETDKSTDVVIKNNKKSKDELDLANFSGFSVDGKEADYSNFLGEFDGEEIAF